MLSQRSICSNRDRRHARGVRFLRPKRGLMPHQADFIFGQVRTDVTLEACVFLGQNGALCRVKRTSSLVKLEPTLRSRRALAQAKSCLMPHQADFIFGQIRTDAMLQACAYSGQIGALCRVKRTSCSVTTISDRLGSGAPNAVSAHASLTLLKATSKTMPPEGSIASTALRNHAQKGKNFGHEGLGEH
jgi:hypothetical protein